MANEKTKNTSRRKSKDNGPSAKDINQTKTLNANFNNLLKSISTNVRSSNGDRETELDNINHDIDEVINSVVKSTTSITSDDMSVFLVKLFNDQEDRSGTNIKTIEDIFEDDNSGLFKFFQQRYQNKNILYEDLELISSQLFELSEAVLTTRDAIATSENFSDNISRSLEFLNTTNDNVDTYKQSIEKLEKDLKLPYRLKNLIIPNLLTYGEYYVYVCPYSKLFEQQYLKKVKDPKMQFSLKESVLAEEFIEDKAFTGSIKNRNKMDSTKLQSVIENYTKDIEVYNDYYSIPLVEGIDLSELVDTDKFDKLRQQYTKKQEKEYKSYDGTIDIKDQNKITKMFEDVQGCYIKYIDPRKIIPIKILDEIIGYYYIHDVNFDVNKAPFSSTIKVTFNGAEDNSEDIESMFMSKITDKIVKSFDKPFLTKNMKFKEMILSALQYNDLYKRQIKFQFIPKDYIIPFKINEDIEGEGHSVLTKSLFYAKLYLSLLVFKMISIITRSNDTKVYYIKNSGLENNITNKVQEVARAVKGRQINFMDLLNYNSIISKIGQYKEMFIPVGKSGERGIDFDVIGGQDIQLNTELMELLRTNMINGTGVPSVIMNYINEADYAKTLTMANSKFIGRVVSLQTDINSSVTELYKAIIRHSNISIPSEIIDSFDYKLSPPKSLNTVNIIEMMSNADAMAQHLVRTMIGESSNDESDADLKDIFYKSVMKEYLPMVDWETIEDLYNKSKVESSRKGIDKKSDSVM